VATLENQEHNKISLIVKLSNRQSSPTFKALIYCDLLNTSIMSTNAASEFKDQNTETDDIVQGGDTVDNSYASGDKEPVAVLKDEEPVEQPNDKLNPDSDEALGKYSVPLIQNPSCILYQKKATREEFLANRDVLNRTGRKRGH